MNLVLIGYRGTGKSTLARILGRMLERTVLSLDAEIVRRAGRTIPEIVADGGWDAFRDLESEVVKDASAEDGLILDCGGGAVLRAANVDALRKHGFLVWLTAPIEIIAARIEGDSNRPSLTGKPVAEEIREVLRIREPLYRAAAHAVVETGHETPETCAARIADLFARHDPAKTAGENRP